eukprot:scaffold1008_cov113-Skeletonema_marinoi.AAC.1
MKGSIESPCIPEAFPVDRSLMRWTTSSAMKFIRLGFACERVCGVFGAMGVDFSNLAVAVRKSSASAAR